MRVASPSMSLVFASVGHTYSHLFMLLYATVVLVVFASGLMLPSERRARPAPAGALDQAD